MSAEHLCMRKPILYHLTHLPFQIQCIFLEVRSREKKRSKVYQFFLFSKFKKLQYQNQEFPELFHVHYTVLCPNLYIHSAPFSFFLSVYLSIFFSFIFISWRLITLQYCSGLLHFLYFSALICPGRLTSVVLVILNVSLGPVLPLAASLKPVHNFGMKHPHFYCFFYCGKSLRI